MYCTHPHIQMFSRLTDDYVRMTWAECVTTGVAGAGQPVGQRRRKWSCAHGPR